MDLDPAVSDLPQALPGRGQQHGTVQGFRADGGCEVRQGPGPDDTVVDGEVSADRVAPAAPAAGRTRLARLARPPGQLLLAN